MNPCNLVVQKLKGRDPARGKQSLYFPDLILEQLHREAVRTDRSFSWLMAMAWRIALPEIKKLSTVDLGANESCPVRAKARQTNGNGAR